MAAFPEGWMSSGQISRDGAFLLMPFFFQFSYRRGSSERNEVKTGKRSDGTGDR